MPASIEFLNAGGAPRANSRYSHAVRNGRTVYICGWMGEDPRTGKIVEGGVEKQTVGLPVFTRVQSAFQSDNESEQERALKNIALCLEAAGSDLGKVVRRRLYFVDIARDMRIVDDVWARLVGEPGPASTAIQVGALAKDGALIEIEVTAAV